MNLNKSTATYQAAEVKLRRLGYRIHEVTTSYQARGIAEGKKIRAQDGLRPLWVLCKYRFVPKALFAQKGGFAGLKMDLKQQNQQQTLELQAQALTQLLRLTPGNRHLSPISQHSHESAIGPFIQRLYLA